MSLDFDTQQVESSLLELFKYAFVTNCHLDEASITPDEMKTLEELDAIEVIENFKDLVIDLLNYKKKLKFSENSDFAKRNTQLEKQIQKLESEIRRHVRVENQLKLHIETVENKLDECENTRTIKKLKQKIKEKEETSSLLESNLQELKHKLYEKCKENDLLKQEITSVKEESSLPDTRNSGLKSKVEARTAKISKYQQLIRSSDSKPKSSRKSLKETNIFRSTASLKHRNSSRKPSYKKSVRALYGHFRSNTDFKNGRNLNDLS